MQAKDLGRIPPHNLEAEHKVLGIFLLSSDKLTVAIEEIEVQDFYSPINQTIYRAMLNLYQNSNPVDLLTVVEELRRMGKLSDVGGASFLAELTTEIISTANLEYYLKIIKDKSTLRKIIDASNRSLDYAFEDAEPVESVVEFVESNIFSISDNAYNNGLEKIDTVLADTFEKIRERSENDSFLTGITTGFYDIDRMLSGLQRTDLILLAARPSMGKTALVINMALNAALHENAKVAIFSLEMSKNQISQRMIAYLSGVPLQKIISGSLESDDWSNIYDALNTMMKFDVHIDDTAGISPLELKAKARRLKSELKGLDLIVIDYLQLMEMKTGRNENRTQEISAISRALKGIAKDLDVPVLALSQLSRANELRGDKRPILSDLRESGAIEQDADVVMFLYRDVVYNKETEKRDIAEINIAKHRNGPIGTVELVFMGEYTKFANKAREN